MRLPSSGQVVLAAGLLCLAACSVRETHTARTATEQLLISTAAERAVERFDPLAQTLKGLRVAVDASKYESVDKPYVVSAVRHLVCERGGLLVDLGGTKYKDKDGKEAVLAPQRVVEVRGAALGIRDDAFGFEIPTLPLPIPQTSLTSILPAFRLIKRIKQESWAKIQLWIYDPADRSYVAESKPLWGSAYYSQWYFFSAGPFDFSEDIYPSPDDLLSREETAKRFGAKEEAN